MSGAETHLRLPPGCRFELRATLDDVGSLEALLEEEREPAPDRTIAILLPDGGAITGAQLVLVTPRRRAYVMSVRTWGGGAAFDRWEAESEAEFGAARGFDPP